MKLTKISSTQNPLIKKIKNIYENPSYSKKNSIFVIEKPKLIFEAINNNIDIEFIFITESELEKFKNKLTFFLNNNKIILIDEKIAKFLSINVSYTEIFALCNFKHNSKYIINKNKNYLLVDSIQDPGNLGTIIRTAFGLGIDGIFLYNCVYLFNNKCTKSCCGANFKSNIYEIKDIDKLLNECKQYNIICTSLDNDSEDLEKEKFSKNNNLIVVGNEGHGVSTQILNYATKKIKIKMLNNIESFNVAIFVGIICFKILRP